MGKKNTRPMIKAETGTPKRENTAECAGRAGKQTRRLLVLQQSPESLCEPHEHICAVFCLLWFLDRNQGLLCAK